MAATALALASRDFGRKYIGKWRVVCANLKSETPNPDWESMRGQLEGTAYTAVKTPYPEVFEYGIHISDGGADLSDGVLRGVRRLRLAGAT
jgi:hypothetical protein